MQRWIRTTRRHVPHCRHRGKATPAGTLPFDNVPPRHQLIRNTDEETSMTEQANRSSGSRLPLSPEADRVFRTGNRRHAYLAARAAGHDDPARMT
jgi:hypothetical protein